MHRFPLAAAAGIIAVTMVTGCSLALAPARPAAATMPVPTPTAPAFVFPLPSPDGYTDPGTGQHVTTCPGDLVWHPETHACSFTVTPGGFR